MRQKKNQKKESKIWLLGYVVYLLLVWGSFRWWVRLPEVIEELWFKPVIWLMPWFWWYIAKGRRPRLFDGDKKRAVFLGLLVGAIYFLTIFWLRRDLRLGWSWDILGLSVVIAVVEETTMSGLFLGLWDEKWGKKMSHVWGVLLLVILVHLPMSLFVYRSEGLDLWGQILLIGGVAGINGWLRQKSNNVISPILARLGLMLAVLV